MISSPVPLPVDAPAGSPRPEAPRSTRPTAGLDPDVARHVDAAFRSELAVDDDLQPELRDLLRDVLSHPGRMFRAQLAWLLHRRWGGGEASATALATAIEYFHSASLLFDDLPAMDDARERRGRPCPHVAFGEGSAILGALALIHRAYGLVWSVMARLPEDRRRRGEEILDATLGLRGVLDGQARDLGFRPGAGSDEVRRVAEGKTVSLVRLTLVLPALAAGAPDEELDRLEVLSKAWGLAYQGLDDLKDELSSAEETGKTAHRDRKLGRPNLATEIGVAAAVREVADHLEVASSHLIADRREAGLEALHGRLTGELAEIRKLVPPSVAEAEAGAALAPTPRPAREERWAKVEKALSVTRGANELLSVVVPVECPDPALAFEGSDATLWSAGGGAWVTRGRVQEVSGTPNRTFARRVAGAGVVGGPDGFAIRCFGGLAFDAEAPLGRPWASFGAGSFLLPRWTLRAEAGQAWLALTVRGDEDSRSARRQWIDRLEERLEGLQRSSQAAPLPGLRMAAHCSSQSWCRKVERALAEIRSGRLQKVVVSRRTQLALDDEVDVRAVLARTLALPTHGGVVFAFRRGDATFLGTTPERLVRVDGCRIQTEALAGTAAVGRAGELQSEKNRAEHAYVVHAVERSLRRLGAAPHRGATERVSAGPMHHLRTPIEGRGTRALDVLAAARELHPTPAVGGLPGPAARDWLRRHEPGRGWYAGPVGWFDGRGGELRVALRCGVVEADRAWTWAGAGIVEGSVPEAEAREVALKERTFQRMLDIEPEAGSA